MRELVSASGFFSKIARERAKLIKASPRKL